MQITFNSYAEMMDFMEKIQGRVSAKEEKAVTTAEEMKQHSVSESCQSTPVSAPAQNVPPVSTPVAPVAPTAPVQTAVPTSRHEYTRDDLARAAMTLMDKGGMVQLQQLLTSYGCETLQQLTEDQFGSFATSLRGMGAQI